MIGKQWMLVTAEKSGAVNTMTASWGGLGVLWRKNVAYIFIRPQRYTKEFIDAGERFTLSFYGGGAPQGPGVSGQGKRPGRRQDRRGGL